MDANEMEDKEGEYIYEKKEINGKEKVVDRYKIGKPLGKGSFGKVYEFESENDGVIYAGKIIDKNIFKEKNDKRDEFIRIQKNKQNIQAETKIQKELKSPRILKVKTFFEDDDNVYIVLEKCSKSLQQLLDDLSKKGEHLTEIEIQYFMFQLIEGLKYLHDKNIIHRDLKPLNLFLNDKYELKIADFGLVVKLNNNDEKVTDFYGTKKYMAPEFFEEPIKGYSFGVDIWAIGIIMYQLFTAKQPFYTSNEIKKADVTFPSDIKMSKAAKDLIKQILTKNQKKRPNLAQILYHDFFHICKFPKILDNPPPDTNLFEKYNPYLIENDVINKDVKYKDLYKLKAPGIYNVQYEDIDKYILKDQSELEGFDNYIEYFHKSKHFNFYYYEVNNGLFGIIFDDGINLVVDDKNKMFYNIINIVEEGEEKEEKTEIERYEIENCPEIFKEKLENILNYNKSRKSNNIIVIQNEDVILNSQNERPFTTEEEMNETEGKEKGENYKDKNTQDINLFYIKKLKEENRAYFLKLSDNTKQVIFKDKVEIIISDEKPNLVYIDKNRKKEIIEVFYSLNNTSEDLKYRLKYIKKYTILEIKEQMRKKYKKLHPDYDDTNDKEN